MRDNWFSKRNKTKFYLYLSHTINTRWINNLTDKSKTFKTFNRKYREIIFLILGYRTFLEEDTNSMNHKRKH